jgi:hypothetical protein
MLLLAVFPYSIYVLLRDFLDAIDERAYNTRNLVIALGAFLAIAVPSESCSRIAQALTFTLALLAVLTIVEVVRALERIGRATAAEQACADAAAGLRPAA